MDVWAMRRAIDCLNTETLLEFEDVPISEVLDHLAVREQLRFRVESPSLTAQRVSISVEKKTLGEAGRIHYLLNTAASLRWRWTARSS